MLSIYSFSLSLSTIQEKVFLTLTDQQKKVAALAIGIFSLIAIAYWVCRTIYLQTREVKQIQEEADPKLHKLKEEIQDPIEEIEKKSEELTKRMDKLSKRVKELTEKFDPNNVPNLITMHLMMDKLFYSSDKYEGAFESLLAKQILCALHRLDENKMQWTMDADSMEFLLALMTHLDPLLNSYLYFSKMNLERIFKKMKRIGDLANECDDKEEYSVEILKFLKQLKDGESGLFPLGCQQHATALCIIKNANLFRLEHYNTGFGSEWHHQWLDSHLCQTCYVIEEIPEDSILDEMAWQEILKFKDAIDMNPVYEWLNSTLGKGGIRRSASKNQEDYEAYQFLGTCTAQCLMAVIREKSMQIARGTPAEKEAFYKLGKTYLFLQYMQDHQHELDATISSQLPPILAKLEAEKTLIEIARDEHQFSDAMEVFEEAFNVVGESAMFEENLMPQEEKLLSRYAYLRQLSKQFSDILWEFPEKRQLLEFKHPVLKLVLAKIDKHLIVEENIRLIFNQLIEEKKEKKWVNQLSWIFRNTPYAHIAIEELRKRLLQSASQEDSEIKSRLFKQFTADDHNKQKIDELIQGLAKKGETELANELQSILAN